MDKKVRKCLAVDINAMLSLPYPRSRYNQGQETFLAPCADKQTLNYDRVPKPPSVPIGKRNCD